MYLQNSLRLMYNYLTNFAAKLFKTSAGLLHKSFA